MTSEREEMEAARQWLPETEEVLYPLDPPKGNWPPLSLLIAGALALLVLLFAGIAWVVNDDDVMFPVQSQPTPTTKEVPK